MGVLARFGKELFWTAFWVFLVLIIGFAVLSWLSTKNIPAISGASSWIEQHAQAS